jgi:hypothetical protein
MNYSFPISFLLILGENGVYYTIKEHFHHSKASRGSFLSITDLNLSTFVEKFEIYLVTQSHSADFFFYCILYCLCSLGTQ